MPYTDSLYTLSKQIESVINSNKGTLGLQDVFYGDQARIPRTPAACVEPGDKRRTLNGAPRRVQVDFTIHIIVYHYLIDSTDVNREANDQLAEAIETKIHEDVNLNGLVIDSLVSEIRSGYQTKGTSLFKSSLLTVTARSQVLLPAT